MPQKEARQLAGFSVATHSACVDLLLQVQYLRLQGADIAGHLRTEGVKLSRAAASGTGFQIAFQHQQVLLDTGNGLVGVALFLQRINFAAQPGQFLVEFALPGQRAFQGGLLIFQHRLFGAEFVEDTFQLGIPTFLAFQLRGQLLKALALLAILPTDALLLLTQLSQLAFQLLDLQFQRFTATGDRRLGGHHLAGNILNSPSRLLADARETLLSGNKLLFHQADLLKAPPAKPAQGDHQGANQGPEWACTGRLHRCGSRRTTIGRAARWLRLLGGIVIVIAVVSPQAGHVIEFVVGIVTHWSTFKKARGEEPVGFNTALLRKSPTGSMQIAAQYNGSRAALQCRAMPVRNAPTKGTALAIDSLQAAQFLRV